MSTVHEAYPLHWPAGHKRTAHIYRENARFDTSFARARDAVVREVEMMTGTHRWGDAGIVISTNIALRRDGLPLANQKEPNDPGVAVYFKRNSVEMCFPCDRWTTVKDNMQAIAKTIEALRGIERWGSADLQNAAYKGFEALPAPATKRPWYQVFGVEKSTSDDYVRACYRHERSRTHPDRGGSTKAFNEVTAAWSEFCKERGINE